MPTATLRLCRPRTTGRVDLIAHLGLLALGAEPCRIHRVDADVGAVRRVDQADEQRLHRRRNGQAFGEEDEALPPSQAPHRVDDGREAVDERVPLLVALQRLELVLHPLRHLRQLRVRRGAHVLRVGAAGAPDRRLGRRRGGLGLRIGALLSAPLSIPKPDEARRSIVSNA